MVRKLIRSESSEHETEMAKAEDLLLALERYYDCTDGFLEPVVPGHPIHQAVGNWRQSLRREKLPPRFSAVRQRLWRLSKSDREQAQDAAADFAELLREMYPSLDDGYSQPDAVETGKWFEAPPPPNSGFQYGPVSGQLQDLAAWMDSGEKRTLKKHNGMGGYYIMKVHARQYSVWLSAGSKYDEVLRRQRGETD